MEKIYYISEVNTMKINTILETKNAKIKNITPIVQYNGVGKGTFGAYIVIETK